MKRCRSFRLAGKAATAAMMKGQVMKQANSEARSGAKMGRRGTEIARIAT